MKYLSLLLPALLIASLAQAAGGRASARVSRRIGVFASFLGDPYPTLVGANLGVNATDFLRLTAGYGTFTSSTLLSNAGTPLGEESLRFTSYGGGARLLVPGWSLSPSLGMSYVHVKVVSATSGSVASQFGDGSGGHFHAAAGLDLTLRFGLHLAAGWNHSLKAGIGGMPYFNFGWFF